MECYKMLTDPVPSAIIAQSSILRGRNLMMLWTDSKLDRSGHRDDGEHARGWKNRKRKTRTGLWTCRQEPTSPTLTSSDGATVNRKGDSNVGDDPRPGLEQLEVVAKLVFEPVVELTGR